MFFKSVVAVVFLAAAVCAQISSPNSTIDPSTVDLTLRNQWCNGQMNTCGTLCSGATNSNNCTSTDLTFSCTCTSNNSAPALALYTQTMPTYICEQVYANCNILNAGVKAALDKCAADEKANCGHLNSTAFVETTSSSSSSSSSTPTSTSSPSGSATGAPTTTSSAGAAATMMAMGGQFGSGLLVAGAAAAFGYIL